MNNPLGSLRVRAVQSAPCALACPLGTDVRGYINLISHGRFPEALELIRQTNPLPAICGRLCSRPCEGVCERAPWGGPLAIAALKRFLADEEFRRGDPLPSPRRPDGPAVAVVGSGPAGLSAAAFLAKGGFRVVILESQPRPGGMLAFLPPFRLPPWALKREIQSIERLGVEIRTGVRVGQHVSLEELRAQGFQAILLAPGAHRPLAPALPGEDLLGVKDALAFIKEQGSAMSLKGQRVVVAGLGTLALDAARLALRQGAVSVRLLFPLDRDLFAAPKAMMEDAIAEGVILQGRTVVREALGEAGRLQRVRVAQTTLGGPDRRERRWVTGTTTDEILDAEVLIHGYGREPEISNIPGLTLTRANTILVAPATLQAGQTDLFAAGDAVSGPRTVVDAIASGRRAAHAMASYLGAPLPTRPRPPANDIFQLDDAPPHAPALFPPRHPNRGTDEVEGTLSAAQAQREADRCLKCSPCDHCVRCLSTCSHRTALMVRPQGEVALLRGPGDRMEELITAGRVSLEGQGTTVEVVSPLCRVNPDLCRGCGLCEEVCPYLVARVELRKDGTLKARVDQRLCRGCGLCAASCPTGAMDQGHYSHALLRSRLCWDEGPTIQEAP